jgi:diguanylate cyclase (GGDEF)-like protein
LRPLLAALVYGSAWGLLMLGLPLTQVDPATLLSNRVNGLTAAVLGWLLAVVTWRKTTVNLLLARQLAERQVQLEAKQQELAQLASRDSLTGLLNRTEMLRQADAELARARRYQQDTSLLLIDLDHFKRVNDEHGHPAGDAVLTATAHNLQRAVRQSDVLARLGGEEFMVLLPQTGLEAAAFLADKLRRQVAGRPVACGSVKLSITCSIGVATVSGVAGEDFHALYHRCDKALYRAKGAGRNRVETSL